MTSSSIFGRRGAHVAHHANPSLTQLARDNKPFVKNRHPASASGVCASSAVAVSPATRRSPRARASSSAAASIRHVRGSLSRRFRQAVRPALQALREDRVAGPVPEENPDLVAAPIEPHEQVATHRVLIHHVPRERRQAVKRLAPCRPATPPRRCVPRTEAESSRSLLKYFDEPPKRRPSVEVGAHSNDTAHPEHGALEGGRRRRPCLWHDPNKSARTPHSAPTSPRLSQHPVCDATSSSRCASMPRRCANARSATLRSPRPPPATRALVPRSNVSIPGPVPSRPPNGTIRRRAAQHEMGWSGRLLQVEESQHASIGLISVTGPRYLGNFGHLLRRCEGYRQRKEELLTVAVDVIFTTGEKSRTRNVATEELRTAARKSTSTPGFGKR